MGCRAPDRCPTPSVATCSIARGGAMQDLALVRRRTHRTDLGGTDGTGGARNRRTSNQGQHRVRHRVGATGAEREGYQGRRATAGKPTLPGQGKLHRRLVGRRWSRLIGLSTARLDDHLRDLGIAARQRHSVPVSRRGRRRHGVWLRPRPRLRSRSCNISQPHCRQAQRKGQSQRCCMASVHHEFENHRL